MFELIMYAVILTLVKEILQLLIKLIETLKK